MVENSQKRSNRNPSDGRETISMSAASDSLTKLPDELATEILSRLGTLNEAVRCSSLLCKRWRNIWRSIDGGILDFDELRQRKKNLFYTTPEEIANRVNQALTCLVHHHNRNLDAFKVRFYYLKETKEVSRWIEFGLTKRVKELALLSNFTSPKVSVSFLTSEFLCQHDLSRLEVLQLKGVSEISQSAMDHIFSDLCPSLRCFSLRNFSRAAAGLVVRVRSSNNLQSLDFQVDCCSGIYIELISAPSLRTFKFSGDHGTQLKFVGDLPHLRENSTDLHLDCSASVSNSGGILWNQHSQHRASKWMLFDKLKRLDLIMCMTANPASFLECTVLLRAAPLLQELSIWFPEAAKWRGEWERRDLGAESTWKHNSLQVLRLHGVRPVEFSVRKPQLELAAYIIMNAPSLNEVLIAHRIPLNGDIYEVKMELETQLLDCSVSPLINFTYR